MAGRPIGACVGPFNGVATALPMSFELATVLKAVSVGGGCDSSGRCSTFSCVNWSPDGVKLISGVATSMGLSGVFLGVSFVVGGGVSMTVSAAGGGMGSSSAGTAGSSGTSFVGGPSGTCAGTSGATAGAGFGAGLGTAGAGLGAANMLAQVFFAASTTGLMTSGVASGACAVVSSCLVSLDSSATAFVSHAEDSFVGTDPAAVRGPAAAPPRPPRMPPRPRSVPLPPRPPRALSTPRRAPSGRPRRLEVPSAGRMFSFALERDLSLTFFGTSEN